MRTWYALAIVVPLAAALLASPADAKSRKLKNSLISVVSPQAGTPARAHPFVNVILLFGTLPDGTTADPSTFKAKFGREDVTRLFEPTYDARGNQTGVRAVLDADRVKIGRRPRNHLRLSVLSRKVPGVKGPRVRDTDRLRFGAAVEPNQPCTAQADADSQVVVPGIPIQLTGSRGSSDPDRDELQYHWDFGDGQTSTEADPSHEYDVQTDAVVATLTVSDGQDTCTDTITMEAVPPIEDGKTPGALFVESAGPLEFGAVAVGSTGTKTVTLRNTDDGATSQLPVRLATNDAAFTLSETDVVLGPGESHDVTITFAPEQEGHRQARIALVANAANRQAVSFLAHGYGGAAPMNGPTLVADPAFFTEIAPTFLGLGTFAYLPDGRRVFVDNQVHTCVVPGGGLGTGDFCLTDADCSANGGTCSTQSTCPSGDNAGAACTVPADCPNSYCPSYTLFDPVDLCSDGKSLFLVSDEGSFTEPNPSAETERAVTLMRMDYDGDGNVTKRTLLGRTTTETAHIACDGFPAAQGGQIYIPEFHNVPDDNSCFRSEREALVRIAKSNGASQVVTSRIDAYEGLGDCDDLDPVNQLEMTRDGSHMVAGFESGGLWQIRPQPLFYSADITELFQIHPDGSIIFAATTDSGSSGLVNLYRITADEVQHGPLPYSALVPCASFTVPNNTLRDAAGRTVAISVAATRTTAGSSDATALVSFIATSGSSPTVPSLIQVVSPSLVVRGTVAFSLPANTTTCDVAGLVNLEALELAF